MERGGPYSILEEPHVIPVSLISEHPIILYSAKFSRDKFFGKIYFVDQRFLIATLIRCTSGPDFVLLTLI